MDARRAVTVTQERRTEPQDKRAFWRLSPPCPRVLAAGVELCAAAAGCRLFDWALHNPYCGLLFRCHCTWPWAGGSAHCNVHHATGPKCPWCNVRNTPLHWLAWAIKDNFTVSAMVLAYVITWLAQTVGPSASPLLPKGGIVARPSVCLPILTRATAAMLTFALLGFVLGLVFYLGTDYPCFLFIVDDGPEGTLCGWRTSRTNTR